MHPRPRMSGGPLINLRVALKARRNSVKMILSNQVKLKLAACIAYRCM